MPHDLPITAETFRDLASRLKGRARIAAWPVAVDDRPSPAAAAVPLRPHGPGETAAQLLDTVWAAVGMPPQERSMAGDTLLLLLPRLSPGDLALLAERVAAMEQPPPLLLARLLRDPRPEIGGLLLERSTALTPDDLLAACSAGEPERLRQLARRRSVPPAVCDRIVASGDLLSMLALLRNAGAEISFETFLRLSAIAGEHPSLQAPLAMRSDLPLAAALDLLWRLPPELRRVVMARYLSRSATLARLLAIAVVAGEPRAPLPPPDLEAALAALADGDRTSAAAGFAALAGIEEATAARIFADREGEPLVVLLKALGLGRGCFVTALERIRAVPGLLREDRPHEELRVVFDALSFTKARVVLLYWNWSTCRCGPYAPSG